MMRRAAGFTMVELLVALAIFALVSAAGVVLLRASVDTQAALTGRLGEGSAVTRLRAMLTAELASAQPRPRRDAGGSRVPAFSGDARGIAFVHAGGGLDGQGITLSRYALADGALVRSATDRIDGAEPGDPAAILRGVTSARWRFRAADGVWADAWRADDAAALPRAVELVLDRRGAPQLALRFLVGPDGLGDAP